MSNYPIAIAQEIVDVFLTAYPRGWAVVQQLFYFRDETIYLMFQKDQKMWVQFKKVVKKVDKSLFGTTSITYTKQLLTALIRKYDDFKLFWSYYNQFCYVYGDEMDYYTFVKLPEEPKQLELPL